MQSVKEYTIEEVEDTLRLADDSKLEHLFTVEELNELHRIKFGVYPNVSEKREIIKELRKEDM